MKDLTDPPPRALSCRMQGHPHYAATLAAMGLRTGRLDCGALIVERRLGPLRLLWLPDPLTLPVHAPGPMLISARDAAQDAQLAGSGAIPLMTPQSRALLPVPADPDAQLALQHQKWRNRLRHGQRAGLKVSHAPLPHDPGHWLLTREEAQRRQKGYRGLPAAFALHWPETRLFTARHKGEVVAALLLLLHAPGASYHIGWTGAEGRRLSAQALLLWQVSRYCAARGITRIDLGPVDTTRAPGLARFKLGAGAGVHDTGHSWLNSRFLAPLGRLIG